MKLSDLIFMAKKRQKLKYNIYLCILFSLTFVIIFLSSSVYHFYVKTINDSINNNIDFRRIFVDTSTKNLDVEQVKKIEGVEAIYSAKYIGQYYLSNNSLFRNGVVDGSIYLRPIISSKDVITSDKMRLNPNESGYLVCPQKFYPMSGTELEGINYFNMLNGKDYIGKEIYIDNQKFKIIDTYDSDKYFISKNECFISFKDFKELIDKQSAEDNPFTIIQADDVEKSFQIMSYLEDNEFAYDPISIMNYSVTAPVRNFTKWLTIIVSIASLILFSFITVKKNKECSSYNQLLLYLGYTKQQIVSLSTFEIMFCYLISVIIGIILYVVIYLYMKYVVFTFALSASGGITIPFHILGFIIIVIYIYVFFINRWSINKNLK